MNCKYIKNIVRVFILILNWDTSDYSAATTIYDDSLENNGITMDFSKYKKWN